MNEVSQLCQVLAKPPAIFTFVQPFNWAGTSFLAWWSQNCKDCSFLISCIWHTTMPSESVTVCDNRAMLSPKTVSAARFQTDFEIQSVCQSGSSTAATMTKFRLLKLAMQIGPKWVKGYTSWNRGRCWILRTISILAAFLRWTAALRHCSEQHNSNTIRLVHSSPKSSSFVVLSAGYSLNSIVCCNL
jgi:hypothetical protein